MRIDKCVDFLKRDRDEYFRDENGEQKNGKEQVKHGNKNAQSF